MTQSGHPATCNASSALATRTCQSTSTDWLLARSAPASRFPFAGPRSALQLSRVLPVHFRNQRRPPRRPFGAARENAGVTGTECHLNVHSSRRSRIRDRREKAPLCELPHNAKRTSMAASYASATWARWDMQTRQICYFLALCEERNFTRAARRCGVSQPSLTNAIISLERALGGRLKRREFVVAVPLGCSIVGWTRPEGDQ